MVQYIHRLIARRRKLCLPLDTARVGHALLPFVFSSLVDQLTTFRAVIFDGTQKSKGKRRTCFNLFCSLFQRFVLFTSTLVFRFRFSCWLLCSHTPTCAGNGAYLLLRSKTILTPVHYYSSQLPPHVIIVFKLFVR